MIVTYSGVFDNRSITWLVAMSKKVGRVSPRPPQSGREKKHAVHQKPVGLDMAFAMVFPVSRKLMILVGLWKAFRNAQLLDDALQPFEIEVSPLRTFQIFLELGSVVDS